MADCSGLLQEGISLVRKASESDGAGEYEQALSFYQHALECFLSVLKLESNERITATLRPKVREYMNRAEKLKQIIATSNSQTTLEETQLQNTTFQSTSPPRTSPRILAPPLPADPTSSILLFPSPPNHIPSLSSSKSSSQQQPNSIQQQPQQQQIPTNQTVRRRSSAASGSVLLFSPSPPQQQQQTEQMQQQQQQQQIPTKKQQHKEIIISYGQKNCSYEKLFGDFVHGISTVSIQDPYIRSKHQIGNFLRFLELIMKFNEGKLTSVELITTRDPESTRFNEQETSLHEISENLKSFGSILIVKYSDTIHDREIILSNGVTIKLGRGLDFYQPPSPSTQKNAKFWLGRFDWDLRPCLETTIDIFIDELS